MANGNDFRKGSPWGAPPGGGRNGSGNSGGRPPNIDEVIEKIQKIINKLQDFWIKNNCVLIQPLDMEVGAATFHHQTVFRALGNKGSILLFSTVAAKQGFINHSIVSTSKAAVEGLTLSLATELAPEIRVNCIAPGFIETPMTEKLDDKRKDAILNSIPMNRIGKPKDLSSAIIFLASQESSYITGQTLHINGGLYMN